MLQFGVVLQDCTEVHELYFGGRHGHAVRRAQLAGGCGEFVDG